MTFPLLLYFPSRYRRKSRDRNPCLFHKPILVEDYMLMTPESLWGLLSLQTSHWTVCWTAPSAGPSGTSNAMGPKRLFSESPFLPCRLFLLRLSSADAGPPLWAHSPRVCQYTTLQCSVHYCLLLRFH